MSSLAYTFNNLLGTVYRQGNLVFSSDGKMLYSAVGNRVSGFDLVHSKSFTFPFEARRNISRLALSPDGAILLAVDDEGHMLMANVFRRVVVHHLNLKGKVAEAWAYGTPVATSPIGSEGMLSADWRAEESAVEAAAETAAADGGWGGLWQSTEADSLARDAARLHSDARLWERCSSRGRALCRTLFDEESLFEQLNRSVAHALTTLRERRAADYPAAMLWHHRQRSTDFFSRWIEAKNAQKDSPSG